MYGSVDYLFLAHHSVCSAECTVLLSVVSSHLFLRFETTMLAPDSAAWDRYWYSVEQEMLCANFGCERQVVQHRI